MPFLSAAGGGGRGGRGFGIATLEEVSRLLQLRSENTGNGVEYSAVSSHNGRICNFSPLRSIHPQIASIGLRAFTAGLSQTIVFWIVDRITS